MVDKIKSENEKLQDKLFLKKESAWGTVYKNKRKQILHFAEDYKAFLKESKTERQCVVQIVKLLENAGFKPFKAGKKQRDNYQVFRNKLVIAWRVGNVPENLRLIGTHIDSPRLDLKPHPLFEDSNLALLKTHYYGGIKKYQWVNTPLALIGVVILKNNKKVEINTGQNSADPIFVIPDLLVHLAKNQMEKKGSEIIEGEELNVLIGSIPVDDLLIKEKVKFEILKYLNDRFGIIEEDFVSAELEFVPAQDPVDVGFDRGLIGSYGQDDRSCVYGALRGLIEASGATDTVVGFFVDKEEIGSTGDSGAESFQLYNFVEEYIATWNLETRPGIILEKTLSISGDVTAGMNPIFKDVHDQNNAPLIGNGAVLSKYGGSRGKYGTNDSHAEYVAYFRDLSKRNKIPWQTGEMGKIDLGGGGTIASFMSRYGMNCIDIGPALLGMHSPFEISSKADVFSVFELYYAFLGDNKRPEF